MIFRDWLNDFKVVTLLVCVVWIRKLNSTIKQVGSERGRQRLATGKQSVEANNMQK